MLEHLHPEQTAAPSRPLLAARRWLPDALSLGRMLLGPLFALSLDDAPIAPLSIALLACATDFVDGRLARALRTGSPRGAALDVSADGFFLLCALGSLAALGRISIASPLAAMVALGALGLRWRREPPRGRAPRRLPDRVGHAAGVTNFALVLVAAAAPLLHEGPWLWQASLGVAALNLAPPVLRRLLPGAPAEARS